MQLTKSVPVVLEDDTVGDHPHEPLVLEEPDEGVGGRVGGERLASNHPAASQALWKELLHVQGQLNLRGCFFPAHIVSLLNLHG